MNNKIINELEADIITFMGFLRLEFPQIHVSPKLHMLEDHLIPFIWKWGAPCGFYGEQGGESIHKTINSMKHNYSNVKNNVEPLTYVMHNHLAATNPNQRGLPRIKGAVAQWLRASNIFR